MLLFVSETGEFSPAGERFGPFLLTPSTVGDGFVYGPTVLPSPCTAGAIFVYEPDTFMRW